MGQDDDDVPASQLSRYGLLHYFPVLRESDFHMSSESNGCNEPTIVSAPRRPLRTHKKKEFTTTLDLYPKLDVLDLDRIRKTVVADLSGDEQHGLLKTIMDATWSFEFGCYAQAASNFEEALKHKMLQRSKSYSQIVVDLESCCATALVRCGAYNKAIEVAQKRSRFSKTSSHGEFTSYILLEAHVLALAGKMTASSHLRHPFIVFGSSQALDSEIDVFDGLFKEIEIATAYLEQGELPERQNIIYHLINSKAELLRSRGDVEAASEIWEHVCSKADSHKGMDRSVLATALGGLAECCLSSRARKGDQTLVHAEAHSLKALERSIGAFATCHPNSIIERRRLAYIQKEAGQLTRSIETLQENWEYCSEGFRYDLFTIRAECDLAQALLEGRRFQPAIWRASSAIEALQGYTSRAMTSKVFNPDDGSFSVDSLEALARCIRACAFWDLGKIDQADEDMKVASTYYLSKYQKESVEHKLVCAHIIALSAEYGDVEAAIQQMDAILFTFEPPIQPTHSEPELRILQLLAELYRKTEDLEAFEDVMEAQLQFKPQLRKCHPVALVAESANLLRSLDNEKMEDLVYDSHAKRVRQRLSEIVEKLSGHLGPQDSMTLSAYMNLAQANMMTQTDIDQARAIFHYVEITRFRIYGRSHPDTIEAHEAVEKVSGQDQVQRTIEGYSDRVVEIKC